MFNSQPATNLTGRVEQLLADRQQHADALARIEQTLAGVAAALEMTVSNGEAATEAEPAFDAPLKRGRGRPPGVRSVSRAPVARSKGRRSRATYATTGDELILAFIKRNRNPTTKEIKALWASEGRRGTADNVLSKLFRENRVRRTPLGSGIKGSRYSLA